MEAIREDDGSDANRNADMGDGQGGMLMQGGAVQFLSTEPRGASKQSQLSTTDPQAPRANPFVRRHRLLEAQQLPIQMQRYDPTVPKPLPQHSQDAYYTYWRSISHPIPMLENEISEEEAVGHLFRRKPNGRSARTSKSNHSLW